MAPMRNIREGAWVIFSMSIKTSEMQPSCTESCKGNINVGSQVINQAAVANIIAAAAAQPSEADNRRDEAIVELSKFKVDLKVDYEKDDTLITINGIEAISRKDIVCIKAKQKSGKTHFNAILIASILRGKWHEVECVEKGLKVIYIDTEQKKRDTQQIMRKAMRMAGLAPVNDDQLQVFNLRDITSTEECRKYVKLAIALLHPDVVIIDGVVDLINDFNDVTDSQELVRELMKMADDGDCCIVTVLHTNKSADDHNMRGHLGTILAQKSNVVFECRKDPKSNIVEVVCTDSRHAPIPEFYFAFDGNGEVVSATEIAIQKKAADNAAKEDKKAKAEEAKFLERYGKVKVLMLENSSAMTGPALRKAIENGGILSKNFITDFIEKMVERKLLIKTGDGIYMLPIENDNEDSNPQG